MLFSPPFILPHLNPLPQALGDVALARGPKEVDRCLMAELAGGLLPGLDPELQQKPVVDLLVGGGADREAGGQMEGRHALPAGGVWRQGTFAEASWHAVYAASVFD